MLVKKCVVCGKVFTTNRTRQMTCSDKCSLIRRSEREAQYRAKTTPENKEPKKKNREETCRQCGKVFVTTNHNQKYCSVECRDKAYKEKPYKPLGTRVFECEFCGDLFESDTKRRFCTPECRLKYEREKKKPKKTKKPKLSLNDVAKLCREECLSYGKYVAKYGL